MARLHPSLVVVLSVAVFEPASTPPAITRPDILRVEANGCAGGRPSRVGTGFSWHSAKEVVTALHVVAGCERLNVHSERDQLTYKVTVVRVLKRADLALLQVAGDATFPPILEISAHPAANVNLTAWGYGEGIPSMRDFSPLRVANSGNPTLQGNIPPEVAKDLRRAGSPALDLLVIPIDAPLAPGLSGAPLLDASGRVRAIADGGVHHGITHVSWAIPARYLTELMQSTESAAGIGVPNAHLSAAEVARAEVFSADQVDPNARTIKCGTATLRRTRTRTLSEAEVGNDSPQGLQQLKMFFGPDPSAISFDVYEDGISGATVAVPSGVQLHSQGPACRGALLNGQIEMIVSVTAIPPGSNPYIISGQFEAMVAAPDTLNWMPDVAWSYLSPFYRPDGLVVRRKAFAHAVPNQYNLPTEYLFETLAARNNTFVGVAGIRRNDIALVLCQQGFPSPNPCPPPNYRQVWAHTALSVHLATFAISALNPNQTAWQ